MWRLLRLFMVALVEASVSRLRRGPLLPSWGFQLEWVVRFLRRDFAESARWPYVQLRKNLDARPYPSRAVPLVSRQRSELGGVPVVHFIPPDAYPRRVLLFFHGGSYIFGSPEKSHADLIARLALLTRVRVVAPAYRLAPEHAYPSQLEDALAVFEALSQEVPATSVVVCGDSAGGHLALSLQLAPRDQGKPGANAAVLISPWLDLSASRPSCRSNEAYDYGRTDFLLRHARDVAGTLALDDPRLSPLFAELSGLPPLLVQVGGAERLRDEGLELVERARRAGVDARADVVPEMPHNPPVLAQYHPACAAATERLAAFVRHRLGAETRCRGRR
jgi:acetyl esterase/lipase